MRGKRARELRRIASAIVVERGLVGHFELHPEGGRRKRPLAVIWNPRGWMARRLKRDWTRRGDVRLSVPRGSVRAAAAAAAAAAAEARPKPQRGWKALVAGALGAVSLRRTSSPATLSKTTNASETKR